MEIITMESAAYKDIVGRIEEIASHVRKHSPEKREQETAGLLDSREVMGRRNASSMSSSGATAATHPKKWSASSGRTRSGLHLRSRRN